MSADRRSLNRIVYAPFIRRDQEGQTRVRLGREQLGSGVLTTDPETLPKHKKVPERYYGSDIRAEAARCFQSGMGAARTSARIGVPVYTVRDWYSAYRRGHFSIGIPLNTLVWDEETKEKVVAMRRGGASWKTIFEETGVRTSTAAKWVEAAQANSDAPVLPKGEYADKPSDAALLPREGDIAPNGSSHARSQNK